MYKVILKMSIRNIQKYKKHYLLVIFLVFFISLIFLTYALSWNNYQEVQHLMNVENYGTWYFMAGINQDEKDILEEYIESFDSTIDYGYMYQQGLDDYNCIVGSMDQSLFEMCHLILKDGRYPENSKEIMLSTSSLSQYNVQLNETIVYHINGKKHVGKVVGIVENSQDLFPHIYTYNKTGFISIVSNRLIGIEYNGVPCHKAYGYLEEYSNYTFNSYGYDANELIAQSRLSFDQVIILVEIAGLSSIAFILLTSSSLKRRTKEFALLRGIGMTTKQLCMMVINEVMMTSFIACLGAIFISFLTTFGISKYFEIKMGYFVYQLSPLYVIGYISLLLCGVLLSALYPVLTSARNSLSGTFDGVKFQYIQVRYHRLKYQKKWRLALRELNVYKKMTIAIICILSVIGIYYICDQDVQIPETQTKETTHQNFQSFHYLSIHSSSQEEINQLLEDNTSDVVIYPQCTITDDFNNIVYKNQNIHLYAQATMIQETSLFEKCQVEGRYPQNDHEVLICQDLGYYDQDDNYVNEFAVNDVLTINQQEYQIVGIVLPNEVISYNELYYFPYSDFYVYPKAYKNMVNQVDEYYDVRFYYQNEQERQYLEHKIKLISGPFTYDSDDTTYIDFYSFMNSMDFSDIDTKYLILPACICLLFCYFLNKNQMLNHFHDYRLYHLIGMTKKDLMIKQFYKALIISFIVLCIEIFWNFMILVYYQLDFIVYKLILSLVILLIVTSIIYCLPLYRLLQQDMMNRSE